SNGYRIYGEAEVNLLQQILFYRELEMSLKEIKDIVHSKTFDEEEALFDHLAHLKQKRERLDELIETVEKSIRENKGEIKMSDQEKFDAFKKDTVQRNEEQYGKEIREKYGEEVVNQSNKKILGMTKEQYDTFEASREYTLFKTLRKPKGSICQFHSEASKYSLLICPCSKNP